MSTTNPNAVATSSFATETEIYLTPDGRIVIADLPAELIDLAAAWGQVEPCEITRPDDESPIENGA
ncbi:MAG: hypothetical protein HZY76_01700 [Anaerolineae bacterium]|nr:MAG: hypothetical protein HZY76_01700 [Anaerolineae bacterium]